MERRRPGLIDARRRQVGSLPTTADMAAAIMRAAAEPLTSGQTLSASVGQFGADYYELPVSAGTTLTFTGESTVPVIGTIPFESDNMWYAARADSSVSSMTHRFDLTNVSCRS